MLLNAEPSPLKDPVNAEKAYNLAVQKGYKKEDINILISQKNINEKISILEGILEDEDENIDLYSNDNILTIQNNNISLAIRSINGNFPDYRQLFPKEFNTKIKVNKEIKDVKK
jgi:DNA polymerase III sliding clamp (beta) subunit (PCNA family)